MRTYATYNSRPRACSATARIQAQEPEQAPILSSVSEQQQAQTTTLVQKQDRTSTYTTSSLRAATS